MDVVCKMEWENPFAWLLALQWWDVGNRMKIVCVCVHDARWSVYLCAGQSTGHIIYFVCENEYVTYVDHFLAHK